MVQVPEEIHKNSKKSKSLGKSYKMAADPAANSLKTSRKSLTDQFSPLILHSKEIDTSPTRQLHAHPFMQSKWRSKYPWVSSIFRSIMRLEEPLPELGLVGDY